MRAIPPTQADVAHNQRGHGKKRAQTRHRTKIFHTIFHINFSNSLVLPRAAPGLPPSSREPVPPHLPAAPFGLATRLYAGDGHGWMTIHCLEELCGQRIQPDQVCLLNSLQPLVRASVILRRWRSDTGFKPLSGTTILCWTPLRAQDTWPRLSESVQMLQISGCAGCAVN